MLESITPYQLQKTPTIPTMRYRTPSIKISETINRTYEFNINEENKFYVMELKQHLSSEWQKGRQCHYKYCK